MKKSLKLLTTIICVSLLSSPIMFSNDTPSLHESYTTGTIKHNSEATILPEAKATQLTTVDNSSPPMIVEISNTDDTIQTNNNDSDTQKKTIVHNTDANNTDKSKSSDEINNTDSNNKVSDTNKNTDTDTDSFKNTGTDSSEKSASKPKKLQETKKQPSSETNVVESTGTKKSVSKNDKQSHNQVKQSSVNKSTSQSSTKKQSHFNNVKTLKAAIKGQDQAVDIATMNGNGTVQIVVTRNDKSAAKQMPTYVSMSCKNSMDGHVYAGAFNTMSNETIVKTIPFSGECTLKVRVDHPSELWNGKYNSIHVSYGNIKYTSGGKPYSKKADWTTKAITKSNSYSFKVPKHFTGNVVLKMTNCSTRGGATDKTASFACDGYVQKNKNTSGKIEILNGGKVVASQNYNIVYQKHHDTFTIPLNNLQSSDITVKVYRDSGPAILLHGPGSSIVGTY